MTLHFSVPHGPHGEGEGRGLTLERDVFLRQSPKAIPLSSYHLMIWLLGMRERLVLCIILVHTWLKWPCTFKWGFGQVALIHGTPFLPYFCLLMQLYAKSPCVRFGNNYYI